MPCCASAARTRLVAPGRRPARHLGQPAADFEGMNIAVLPEIAVCTKARY